MTHRSVNMAGAATLPNASLPPLHKIPPDMTVLFWNLCGALHLAPMTIRSVMNYVCRTKSDADNYRTYVQKVRGKSISDNEWKQWCRFSDTRLQTSQNPNQMDTTDLFCLIQVLLQVREGNTSTEKIRQPEIAYVSNKPIEKSVQTDHSPELRSITEAAKSDTHFINEQKQTQVKNIPRKKFVKVVGGKKYKLVKNVAVQASEDISKIFRIVQIVKNLRNDTMHSEATARNPKIFCKLVPALHDLIKVTADTYSLSEERTNEMKKKLDDEIYHLSSANKTALPYICASLLHRGKEETKELWESRFSQEHLMFDFCKVKQQDIFYPPRVRLRNGQNSKVLPYVKIFEATEDVVILSGVVGSGKSTFLKNLTLQFFELQQKNVNYLKDFNFLVYIDLEDRKIKSLSEIVEEQFRNLCKNFTKEEILEALFCFDVLFLVDAFDGANSNSKGVLFELMKEVWKFNFPVIITTRPQAAAELRQQLSKKNVSSIEYEILPLVEFAEQLKFLAKYECYLCGCAQKEEMQKCFLDLNHRVRDMFADPINLVLFCYLFKNHRERLFKFEKPSQVAEEIFLAYKTIIERKLSDSNYSDLSVLIDDIFLIIGELAWKFMGYSEFFEDEVNHFYRKCKNLMKSGFSEADTQLSLSVVLKIQRSLPGKDPVKWKFHHKCIQELFASRYLKEQLSTTNKSLQQILEEAAATKIQTLGTLQYVVQDLSIKNPILLDRLWPQLKKAMQEAGVVSHEDWQRCMLSCPDVVQVAKQAATVTRAEKTDWIIRSVDDIDAVVLMLPHAQPRRLEVHLRSMKLRTSRWKEVVWLTKGDLHLSVGCLYSEEQNDDFLLPLRGSRCRLLYYSGPVATVDGVDALAYVAAPEAVLNIWLLAPLELSALQGKYKELKVFTKPISAAGRVGSAAPLPAHPPPTLIVWCTSSGSLEDLVHTVITLAPAGNRYRDLFVRRNKLNSGELSESELSNEKLDSVARTLQRLNIRTVEDAYIKQSKCVHIYYRFCITDVDASPAS
ncbi:P-loop containing nucleoside triphosphate hydrolase [Trinorchestia longiramus]|nr:P-loop containing nucleoside triphosphate hydrolase [Trinorchestia longiramus]